MANDLNFNDTGDKYDNVAVTDGAEVEVVLDRRYQYAFAVEGGKVRYAPEAGAVDADPANTGGVPFGDGVGTEGDTAPVSSGVFNLYFIAETGNSATVHVWRV